MLEIIFMFFFSTAKAIVTTVVDLIVNGVLGNIFTWLREEFTAFADVEQNLIRLTETLVTIENVVRDAENNTTPESAPALRTWLVKIKNAAAKGRNLLDVHEGNDGSLFYKILVAHGTKELFKRLDEIAAERDQFNLTARLFHGNLNNNNQASLEPSLEPNRLGARSLKFTNWDYNGKKWTWEWLTIRNVRIEVAKLIKVHWLEVRGEKNMSELCSGVEYDASYEVKLTNDALGWENPITLDIKLPGSVQSRQVSILQRPREQWFEVNVGNFRAEDSGNVRFDLKNVDTSYKKTGLVIKGVIIRPCN